jgi:hypothetical protein
VIEEWITKVLEEDGDGGEEVSSDKFILAGLEQFGVVDRRKHIRPLIKVRSRTASPVVTQQSSQYPPAVFSYTFLNSSIFLV